MNATHTDLNQYMQTTTQAAKAAASAIATASTQTKNTLLTRTAYYMAQQQAAILEANALDIQAATDAGISEAYLDRLTLTPERIEAMIDGLNQVALLDDPVGKISELTKRPSGIEIGKMRTPIGVIAMIYESRPNVTIDAAALCLKSGNACILRGGSEAFHSNHAIGKCILKALKEVGLPQTCVQVLDRTDRATIDYLATAVDTVDVIIPRGGRQLIERISNIARVPVIKHLDGICHVFIDESADENMAINIAMNAKTRRYGVCNAMETLLVHQQCAERFLPTLGEHYTEKGVEIRGCSETQRWISNATPAQETDWATEYLAPILSIKVVADLETAIQHIEQYSSAHTDAIITQNISNSRQFINRVNSSSVMVNTSTAFADGFEYGLGAEIGISTDKVNVRGPVGLEGLTSQKYVVFSDGATRN